MTVTLKLSELFWTVILKLRDKGEDVIPHICAMLVVLSSLGLGHITVVIRSLGRVCLLGSSEAWVGVYK